MSGRVLSTPCQAIAKVLSAGSSCSKHFFTLEQVGFHDNIDDCWVVLFDKVYDITEFILMHPGGENVLVEHAGRDATLTFLSVGHGEKMEAVLSQYLVGYLTPHERIWLKRPQATSSSQE